MLGLLALTSGAWALLLGLLVLKSGAWALLLGLLELTSAAKALLLGHFALKNCARKYWSKMLQSVLLCSVPLYSAPLCSVHGYARVHTSIYIYIYIYTPHSYPHVGGVMCPRMNKSTFLPCTALRYNALLCPAQ